MHRYVCHSVANLRSAANPLSGSLIENKHTNQKSLYSQTLNILIKNFSHIWTISFACVEQDKYFVPSLKCRVCNTKRSWLWLVLIILARLLKGLYLKAWSIDSEIRWLDGKRSHRYIISDFLIRYLYWLFFINNPFSFSGKLR